MRWLFLFAIVFFTAETFCQKEPRHEFAVGGGISRFSGDIPSYMGSAMAAGYSYRINSFMSARATLGQSVLKGNDALGDHEFSLNRNLNFRTPVQELAVQLEFWLKKEEPQSERLRRLNAAVYAGIGLIHFEPTAIYDGWRFRLRPLGTEGQHVPDPSTPDPYGPFTLFSFGLATLEGFPAMLPGLKVKYQVNEKLGITLEAATRNTFTDYLDDVSTVYYYPDSLAKYGGEYAPALADRRLGTTSYIGNMRGDPTDFDRYFTAILSLAWRLGAGKE